MQSIQEYHYKFFPLPFFPFHLVMVCAQNPSCYMYQGAQNMPGNLCQGSCNMLHTPNTCNMPKMCMIWTQNMALNAKVKKMGQRVLCSRKNCNITLVNWMHLLLWAYVILGDIITTIWSRNFKHLANIKIEEFDVTKKNYFHFIISKNEKKRWFLPIIMHTIQPLFIPKKSSLCLL